MSAHMRLAATITALDDTIERLEVLGLSARPPVPRDWNVLHHRVFQEAA